MAAATGQLSLLDLLAAVRLDEIVAGVILAVPACADRNRPSAYKLEVMKARPADRRDRGPSVLVRGRAPRLPGSVARRVPFWVELPLDQLSIIGFAEPVRAARPAARPAPARPDIRETDHTPEGEISLPLSGPGGWSLTSQPCPECGTRCTVRAQLGDDVVDPSWECRACGASGRVEESAR